MPSPESPQPEPARLAFQLSWSRDLLAGARGLSLARERGWLLAWDETGWLTLLDQAGQRQAQRQLPGLVAACAADDGSAYVAAGKGGELWWLTPDFTTRWETKLASASLTLAVDPFGQYVAVADSQGQVHFFHNSGTSVSQSKLPRPLRHLAFVPAAPVLIGGADFGLVAALNLKGESVWMDGLVANVGGLATDGAGQRILFARFSEGLHGYQADGKKLAPVLTSEPCRLVSQSFDGNRVLVANMTQRLLLLDAAGKVRATHETEKPIAALALGPLGKEAFVALAKGPVLRLEVKSL